MLWLDPGIFNPKDLSSATSFLGGDRGVKRLANVWVSQADGVARIRIAVRQRDKRAVRLQYCPRPVQDINVTT